MNKTYTGDNFIIQKSKLFLQKIVYDLILPPVTKYDFQYKLLHMHLILNIELIDQSHRVHVFENIR